MYQKCNISFVKTHKNAKLPERNHGNIRTVKHNVSNEHIKKEVDVIGTHDSGFDMFCCEGVTVPAKGSAVVPVGLKLAHVDPGFWIKIESRSGLGFKHSLACHPGIIDNAYRGDMGIKMYNFSDVDYTFECGDKVCQIIVYPLIDMNIQESDEATDTHRGEKGFGSSGK